MNFKALLYVPPTTFLENNQGHFGHQNTKPKNCDFHTWIHFFLGSVGDMNTLYPQQKRSFRLKATILEYVSTDFPPPGKGYCICVFREGSDYLIYKNTANPASSALAFFSFAFSSWKKPPMAQTNSRLVNLDLA